jgi:hypothetical protein
MQGDFTEAAREYERVLRALGEMHEGVISPPARAWNRLFGKLDKPGRVLRQTAQGREFISGMMADSSVTARISAAAAALFWDEKRARAVLESVRDGNFGLQSTTARYTIIEFDRGGLQNLRPDDL